MTHEEKYFDNCDDRSENNENREEENMAEDTKEDGECCNIMCNLIMNIREYRIRLHINREFYGDKNQQGWILHISKQIVKKCKSGLTYPDNDSMAYFFVVGLIVEDQRTSNFIMNWNEQLCLHT